MDLALAALVILGAAFVQGVTGFAHALLAIGALTALYGAEEAILILSFLAPVIAVAIFLRVRKDVDWKEVLVLYLPLGLIGTPLGILLFKALPEDVLTRIVGAMLVVSAGYFLTPWSPRPRDVPLAVGLAAGATAGFLSGLTSTGGPPLVLYLYARELGKRKRMAILQGVFLLGSLTKVAMLIPAGLVRLPTLGRSAVLVLPMVAGVLLGQAVFDRIPAEALRKVALWMLVVIGAWLLVS